VGRDHLIFDWFSEMQAFFDFLSSSRQVPGTNEVFE
jgi:hypothetical protein